MDGQWEDPNDIRPVLLNLFRETVPGIFDIHRLRGDRLFDFSVRFAEHTRRYSVSATLDGQEGQEYYDVDIIDRTDHTNQRDDDTNVDTLNYEVRAYAGNVYRADTMNVADRFAEHMLNMAGLYELYDQHIEMAHAQMELAPEDARLMTSGDWMILPEHGTRNDADIGMAGQSWHDAVLANLLHWQEENQNPNADAWDENPDIDADWGEENPNADLLEEEDDVPDIDAVWGEWNDNREFGEMGEF